MKWLLLAAGVLGGIGWLWYAWTEPNSDTGEDLMARYRAIGGQDPEDNSKLETLRQIARAQQRGDS